MWEIIAVMVAGIGSLACSGLMFSVIKYVPSRREFEMHERLDNERYACVIKAGDEIKTMIAEVKADLIREFKNGHNRD